MNIAVTTLITMGIPFLLIYAPQQDRKAGYQEVSVEKGGTIVGTVTLTDAPARTGDLKIAGSDEVCHKQPIPDESLVVSEDGEVRWAVVSIQGIKRGKAFPDSEDVPNPTLDQRGCRFAPHVVIVPARQDLTVLNSDGVLHNVHTKSMRNRSFNRAMPSAVTEISVSFKRPERIHVVCDAHPWMSAWIIVAGHPYHDVTGADGSFALTDVPPGTYALEVWHETLGTRRLDVTVEAGKEVRVDLDFSVKAG